MMVAGTATVTGNLTSSSYLITTNRIIGLSDASINGGLYVANDSSLNGNMMVAGTATVTGNLTSSSYVISTNRIVGLSDASINGGLYVANDSSLNGKLFVLGDSSMNGNLKVGGNLIVPSTTGSSYIGTGTMNVGINQTTPSYALDVTGQINATSTIIGRTDLSLNSRLLVGGDSSMNGNVFVSGDLSANGNLKAGGNLIVPRATGTSYIGTGTMNVGINKTNPIYPLDVSGQIGFTSVGENLIAGSQNVNTVTVDFSKGNIFYYSNALTAAGTLAITNIPGSVINETYTITAIYIGASSTNVFTTFTVNGGSAITVKNPPTNPLTTGATLIIQQIYIGYTTSGPGAGGTNQPAFALHTIANYA